MDRVVSLVMDAAERDNSAGTASVEDSSSHCECRRAQHHTDTLGNLYDKAFAFTTKKCVPRCPCNTDFSKGQLDGVVKVML